MGLEQNNTHAIWSLCRCERIPCLVLQRIMAQQDHARYSPGLIRSAGRKIRNQFPLPSRQHNAWMLSRPCLMPVWKGKAPSESQGALDFSHKIDLAFTLGLPEGTRCSTTRNMMVSPPLNTPYVSKLVRCSFSLRPPGLWLDKWDGQPLDPLHTPHVAVFRDITLQLRITAGKHSMSPQMYSARGKYRCRLTLVKNLLGSSADRTLVAHSRTNHME